MHEPLGRHLFDFDYDMFAAHLAIFAGIDAEIGSRFRGLAADDVASRLKPIRDTGADHHDTTRSEVHCAEICRLIFAAITSSLLSAGIICGGIIILIGTRSHHLELCKGILMFAYRACHTLRLETGLILDREHSPIEGTLDFDYFIHILDNFLKR